MNDSRLTWSLVAVGLVVVGLLVATVGFGITPRLGLDLQGGISVILTPETETGEPPPDDVLNETVSIVRDRVDRLGISEPEIARQGGQILVQLPGVEDRQRARNIIGQTAKLTFRPVQQVYRPGTPQYQQVGPNCAEPGQQAPTPAPGSTPGPTAGPTSSPAPSPSVTAGAAADPTATGPVPTGPAVTAAGSGISSAQVHNQLAAQPGGSPSPGAGPATTAPSSPAPGSSPAPSPPGSPQPQASPTAPATAAEVGETLAEDQAYILCGTRQAEGSDADGAQAPATGPPPKYRVGPAALSGEGVADALAVTQTTGQGAVTNNWEVQLDLNSQGASQFAEITGQLACERDQGAPGGGQLAIVLDAQVESAPQMNPSVQCGVGITGGQARITVGGQEQEARDLALVLKTGALPLTLVPSSFQSVSPTLGAQALQAGIIAGLIGLALVAIYLIFFYRWLGAVAVGGLAVFGVTVAGLLSVLGQAGFTLTLAGVAGIIVSVGIAADSSILYFERIRDELETGKTVRTSVRRGFQPAFRTNLTGNTVTIAAAAVLYFLAVGPVRGFAFTLGLSTALDLVILYFYTRPAVQLIGNTRLMRGTKSRMPGVVQAGGSE